MSIDKQYMKKLLEPLMNRTGIKINMYFSDLANNDIQVKDKKNIVDEKFLLLLLGTYWPSAECWL